MKEDVYRSSDSNFSVQQMKKIIKSQTNKRVSKDSANELGLDAEEYAEQIAEKAVEIAEEHGRETVREEDIREVLRRKREN